MKTLYINARFIDRPVTGVERVARELTRTLLEHHTDTDGCIRVDAQRFRLKLIAPRNSAGATSFCNYPIWRKSLVGDAGYPLRALYGHFWEQFELPLLTRDGSLLSLCNVATLVKRDQFVFIHDAQPFAIPKNFKPWARAWYQLNYRVGAKRAKGVLVNSKFTKNELQYFIDLDPQKIKVCPLGCDHIHRIDIEPNERTRISEPFVLAFAAQNPNKNFRLITNTIRLMGNDAPLLVVVGDPDNRIFADANLPENRALHLGRVSDTELSYLLCQADALLYPSIYEGFGLPPLEAMALGCPVIVSNQGALPEVVGEAGLYCEIDSERSLAAKLRLIKSSSVQASALQRRGRDRAAEYTWQRCAASLIQALNTDTNQQHCVAANSNSPQFREITNAKT